MSQTLSRRQLAQYAADELLKGVGSAAVASKLAAVLKESHRTQDVELLARDISWELETRGKAVSAQVTSANALSDSLKQDIIGFIKNATKTDKVSLEESVDKSVLGGIKIETAVHLWDKTVATKLRNIREAF
jgi:F0F1-type ATP synthase delta subunit